MPFISLGAFILIFGFFAFNGGSQGRISSSGDGSVVALAITNTLLGCIGGGLAVLFIIKIFKGGKWSLIQLVNGCLAGLNVAAFLLLLLIVIGTLPLNIYVYESLERAHAKQKHDNTI